VFQPLFGHGAMEPVAYQQTSNGELFYVDDAEIDVVAMATTEQNIPQLASPSVNGRLFLIDHRFTLSALSLSEGC